MALLSSIVGVLLTVNIIAIPIGFIVGIIFAVQAHKAQDVVVKRRKNSRMWWALIIPVATLVLIVVIYGLTVIVANTFK